MEGAEEMQLSLDLGCDAETTMYNDSASYMSKQIITYIGNKRSLLPLIQYAMSIICGEIGRDKLSILDLFSGSGIVARLLKQYSSFLYVNDLELYSAVNNACYLSNKSVVEKLNLTEVYQRLLASIKDEWRTDGFISEMYAPADDEHIQLGERVFYTRRNAEYLDTARTQIGLLSLEVQPYFLAPLIASASVHTNTSGVFKGFYKDGEGVGCFGGVGKNALTRILGDIEVQIPVLSNYECKSKVLQMNAIDAVELLPHVDVAYLDPPYNQHPYGSNYFMLNLLASYKKPNEVSSVSGIPKNWNRSNFNKRAMAQNELFKVIEQCDASYVLISYNSEGFIQYEDMVSFLEQLGTVRIIETQYNTFRGSRNLRNRDIHVTEYLFLLRKAA